MEVYFGAGPDAVIAVFVHCVSKKNDTDVAHYNFDADHPILIIFGRDVAERVCYQTMICYVNPPLLTNVSALPGKHEPRKLCLFSHAAYHVSKTKWLGEK